MDRLPNIGIEYEETLESEDIKCPYCGEFMSDSWEIVRSDRLKEQISECQNQSPTKLEYRYNFTRCVFEGEGKTIVCNLVMRNSCLEIKNIDENCEVLE